MCPEVVYAYLRLVDNEESTSCCIVRNSPVGIASGDEINSIVLDMHEVTANKSRVSCNKIFHKIFQQKLKALLKNIVTVSDIKKDCQWKFLFFFYHIDYSRSIFILISCFDGFHKFLLH